MNEQKVYMTYNEFKMCCILFCKTFEGKEYGKVVKKCYNVDKNIIISLHNCSINDYSFFVDGHSIFDYTITKILNIYIVADYISLKTYEDFLNHFNIHSKDIVC